MSATFETVLNDALHLTLEERSRIATRLIESVDDDDGFELSPAWKAEIDRRIESTKNGKATLIDHDEAIAGVRRKLAQQRAAKRHA